MHGLQPHQFIIVACCLSNIHPSIHGPHVRMHVAYLAKQLVAASRVLRLLSLTELYYSPSFSMINLHVSLHVK